MPLFHLRFDHRSEEDLAKHLDFILRLPGKDKVVALEKKHTNGVMHTHALFDDDRSLSRVRSLWKTKFPDVDGKADKQYQCAIVPEAEHDATRRYVCKGEALGDFKILLNKGFFTNEVTESLHAEYWKINAELRAKHAPKTSTLIHVHEHVMVRAPRKKKPTFFELVTEGLDRKYPGREWKVRDWKIMFAKLYEFHGANFRPWGPNQIMNELRVLLNHYCYEEYFTHAMQEVIDLKYLQD